MSEPYQETLRLSSSARAEDSLSAGSSLLWISLSHSSRQEVDNMERRTKKPHNGSILGNANYSVRKGYVRMTTGISHPTVEAHLCSHLNILWRGSQKFIWEPTKWCQFIAVRINIHIDSFSLFLLSHLLALWKTLFLLSAQILTANYSPSSTLSSPLW